MAKLHPSQGPVNQGILQNHLSCLQLRRRHDPVDTLATPSDVRPREIALRCHAPCPVIRPPEVRRLIPTVELQLSRTQRPPEEEVLPVFCANLRDGCQQFGLSCGPSIGLSSGPSMCPPPSDSATRLRHQQRSPRQHPVPGPHAIPALLGRIGERLERCPQPDQLLAREASLRIL